MLQGIEAFLVTQRERGKHVFLVFDEVQNMPFEAIEELRMLSNYQRDSRPLMQCILLGQPEFRERLGHPEMDQIRQRIIATYHLGPLIADATREYIGHRLRTVGWNGDRIFTDRTYAMVQEATGGVPRQINVLCGRFLLYAALEENHIIDETIVDAVLSEISAESYTEADAGGAATGNQPQPASDPVEPSVTCAPSGGVVTSKLLDELGAAEILSLSRTTLRRWRSVGTGPAFVKIGAAVRYKPSALRRFIEHHRQNAAGGRRTKQAG